VDFEQLVSEQPEPSKSPVQKLAPLDSASTPEPLEELTEPVPVKQDEILQQPSNLRQAAQAVVVPVQNKKSPLSSTSLFAGLIGLGVFALIVGLLVARRGVPGAIAS
jgi:hypothetical protein